MVVIITKASFSLETPELSLSPHGERRERYCVTTPLEHIPCYLQRKQRIRQQR